MTENTSLKGTRPGQILALLFAGVFMGALDISIIGPVLHPIQHSIAISVKNLGWVYSIYVLFNLVGISFFARLSDIYGRRYIYMINIALFGLGSLLVAFTDSYGILLLGRAIQGFGASGIFPVASAVIGDVFPAEKRGRMLGLIGAVWGIAFLVGPPLAGLMLYFFEWHVLFLINIPIAIVLLYYSNKMLPSVRIDKPSALDPKGIILLGLLLGCFTYGMNNLQSLPLNKGIQSFLVWPFFLSSILLLIVLVNLEKHSPKPLINLKLFKSRQIRIVSIIAFLTGLLQSCFVFIPHMAGDAFHTTAAKASFLLIPFVLAMAIGSPLFGRMLDKTGSKVVILIGLVLMIIATTMLSLFASNFSLFITAGVFFGLGLSILSGSSLRYIMLNEVDIHQRALTQGLLTIFVSMGQITGGAVVSGIVARFVVLLDGYQSVFIKITILIVIILIISIRLRNRTDEKELIRQHTVTSTSK
jgi:MFS family permease